MDHTLTKADVLRIHAEEVLRGKSREDALAGTRTVVQSMLHTQLPSPHSDVPAKLVGKQKLEPAEKACIRAHQVAQLTEAELIASERARSGPDGTHADAHHFAQKEHQKALWVEADRLVAEALGGAS